MKRLSLISLLVCGLYVTSFAQENEKDFSRYGVLYAQNMSSQLYYDPTMPEYGKTLWIPIFTNSFGVFADQVLIGGLCLNTQLLYQRKGFLDDNNLPDDFEYFTPSYKKALKNRFNYLTVELNPTYYFGQRRKINPYISIGINLDYLVKMDLVSDEFPLNISYPLSEYSDIRNGSWGLNGGAGLVISNLVLIEGRMQVGVMPIQSTERLKLWNWLGSLILKMNVKEVLAKIKK